VGIKKVKSGRIILELAINAVILKLLHPIPCFIKCGMSSIVGIMQSQRAFLRQLNMNGYKDLKYTSYQQLHASIEDYITWYNNERLHSSLGYLTL